MCFFNVRFFFFFVIYFILHSEYDVVFLSQQKIGIAFICNFSQLIICINRERLVKYSKYIYFVNIRRQQTNERKKIFIFCCYTSAMAMLFLDRFFFPQNKMKNCFLFSFFLKKKKTQRIYRSVSCSNRENRFPKKKKKEKKTTK